MAGFLVKRAPTETARCRGCGRSIVWVETEAGKRMPLDRLEAIATDGEFVRVDSAASHWSTCPNATAFRNRRGRGGSKVGNGVGC